MLGLGLGYAGMAALRAAIPPFMIPAEANIALDLRVLLFTFVLSVLTGIVFQRVEVLPVFAISADCKSKGCTAGLALVIDHDQSSIRNANGVNA